MDQVFLASLKLTGSYQMTQKSHICLKGPHNLCSTQRTPDPARLEETRSRDMQQMEDRVIVLKDQTGRKRAEYSCKDTAQIVA